MHTTVRPLAGDLVHIELLVVGMFSCLKADLALLHCLLCCMAVCRDTQQPGRQHWSTVAAGPTVRPLQALQLCSIVAVSLFIRKVLSQLLFGRLEFAIGNRSHRPGKLQLPS